VLDGKVFLGYDRGVELNRQAVLDRFVYNGTAMRKKKEQADPSPEMVSRVFSMMGRKGGPARAEMLTAKRRKEIAQKAARTRWGKKAGKTEG
jgi:hypothetical protein